MKIFLIGFMGSGKSFVARKIAASMQLPCIDLDSYIEEKGGQTIAKIFEFGGEGQFRKLETLALKELIDKQESFVMACGGGTPCFNDNMKLINDAGISVFIDAKEDLIFERIKDSGAKRPLLKGKTLLEIRKFINDKLAERISDYEKAHLSLTVSADEGYLALEEYFKKFDIN